MNGNERQESSRRFTEDEMRTARETSLPDLLGHLGYQVQKIGSFYTTKEMDSLRIKAGDPGRWFRGRLSYQVQQSEAGGGGKGTRKNRRQHDLQ